jgi:segregation and condensation protein A
MASAEHSDYQVDLATFRGPLDLLLYLVKRDEVDILDIPIARIAEQFKQYLEVLQIIDVERAGDFLVMASMLMEIKARMVLPRPEESAEVEEDPRLGLVRQLMQYKRLKEAAAALERRAEEQGQRLARQPPANPPPRSDSRPLEPVELWDLVSAFGRLMRETLALQPQEIVVDQTPLHIYMEMVLERLRAQPRLPLSALFEPPYTRYRLVGLFLALLELTKGRRIIPEQSESFSDIIVTLAPETEGQTP